jgi:hypothetical protein
LTFLRNSGGFFSEPQQREYVLLRGHYELVEILTLVDAEVRDAVQSRGGTNDREIRRIVDRAISARLAEVEAQDILDGFDDTFGEELVAEYKEALFDQVPEVLENLPVGKRARPLLERLFARSLTRDVFVPNSYSGIVFAGFGENEIFPVLVSYKLDAHLRGRLRLGNDRESVIEAGMSAAIVPFAQSDEVWSFMEGINPYYHLAVMAWIRSILGQYPTIVQGLVDKSMPSQAVRNLTRKLARLGGDLVKALEETTAEYRKRHHVNPVLAAVEVLPKDELANMAESLVSLTSFKQRMSMDAETVGGPVDVAVISKGDGFIWIRRKHYFDPKYNPHFITNYFRDREEFLGGEGEEAAPTATDGSDVPVSG